MTCLFLGEVHFDESGNMPKIIIEQFQNYPGEGRLIWENSSVAFGDFLQRMTNVGW